MRYHKVPDETVRRLPVYFRALIEIGNNGQEGVSSEKQAEYPGFKAFGFEIAALFDAASDKIGKKN